MGSVLKLIHKIILSSSALALGAFAQPQPSLCKSTEHPILNAQMGKQDKALKFSPNGKVLSLCADRKTEPFSEVVYRFGKLEKIELEVIGNTAFKFYLHSEQTSPKTADSTIWFSKGQTVYLVNECSGMCSGVWLYVFQGGKKIAEMVSPTEGETYVSNIGSIDFSKVKSPAFQRKDHKLNLN